MGDNAVKKVLGEEIAKKTIKENVEKWLTSKEEENRKKMESELSDK